MAQLSNEQLWALTNRTFGDLGSGVVNTMYRIALAESSGRTDAKNLTGRDRSYGLWQINTHPEANPDLARFDLTDPEQNARAARIVYDRQGPTAWTTYGDVVGDGNDNKVQGGGFFDFAPAWDALKGLFGGGGVTRNEDQARATQILVKLQQQYQLIFSDENQAKTVLDLIYEGMNQPNATDDDIAQFVIESINNDIADKNSSGQQSSWVGTTPGSRAYQAFNPNAQANSSDPLIQNGYIKLPNGIYISPNGTPLDANDPFGTGNRNANYEYQIDANGQMWALNPANPQGAVKVGSPGQWGVSPTQDYQNQLDQNAFSNQQDVASGLNQQFGADYRANLGEAGATLRTGLGETAANDRARLSAAVQGFDSVNRLAPQLGALALQNADFTAQMTQNPSDYLARAFFQNGGTSPLPVVSQADLINQLRANIQQYNEVLSGFNTDPLNNPYFTPMPTTLPATGFPIAPPNYQMPPAGPVFSGGLTGFGGGAQEGPVQTSPSAPAGPSPSSSPYPVGFNPSWASQAPPQVRAAMGLPPAPPPPPPSRISGLVEYDGGAYAAGTPGGYTTAPVFMVGDSPSGRPTGNEELVINPTQQPVMVISNDNLPAFGKGTRRAKGDRPTVYNKERARSDRAEDKAKLQKVSMDAVRPGASDSTWSDFVTQAASGPLLQALGMMSLPGSTVERLPIPRSIPEGFNEINGLLGFIQGGAGVGAATDWAANKTGDALARARGLVPRFADGTESQPRFELGVMPEPRDDGSSYRLGVMPEPREDISHKLGVMPGGKYMPIGGFGLAPSVMPEPPRWKSLESVIGLAPTLMPDPRWGSKESESRRQGVGYGGYYRDGRFGFGEPNPVMLEDRLRQMYRFLPRFAQGTAALNPEFYVDDTGWMRYGTDYGDIAPGNKNVGGTNIGTPSIINVNDSGNGSLSFTPYVQTPPPPPKMPKGNSQVVTDFEAPQLPTQPRVDQATLDMVSHRFAPPSIAATLAGKTRGGSLKFPFPQLTARQIANLSPDDIKALKTRLASLGPGGTSIDDVLFQIGRTYTSPYAGQNMARFSFGA